MKSKATSRSSLSKATRFEVFKRDSFACQYCGQKAPDVVLEVDHIQPVSKEGSNNILNLVTSCRSCNAGKSNRLLSDSSVVEKQRAQLAELQERKEQIEMMFDWQKGLANLDNEIVEKTSQFWSELVLSFGLNDNGKRTLKKLLTKFSVDEVMKAMRVASEQYIEYVADSPTPDSVEKAWNYVGRICSVAKAEKDRPYLRDLFYIRGILRNRLSFTNDAVCIQLLEEAYLLDATVEDLREHSKTVRTWTEWRTGIENFIAQQEGMLDGLPVLNSAILEKTEQKLSSSPERGTGDNDAQYDTEVAMEHNSLEDALSSEGVLAQTQDKLLKPLQLPKRGKGSSGKNKRRR